MGRLVFACLWTAGATFFVIATFDQVEGFERMLLICFPLFGVLFTVLSFLSLRRYSTLHTKVVEGETIYIWTNYSGAEERSHKDPRPDWEAAEGDGDGDGGGGD